MHAREDEHRGEDCRRHALADRTGRDIEPEQWQAEEEPDQDADAADPAEELQWLIITVDADEVDARTARKVERVPHQPAFTVAFREMDGKIGRAHV